MNRLIPSAAIALVIILLVSCSGSGPDPVTPSSQIPDEIQADSENPGTSSIKLWGYWEAYFDKSKGEIGAVPLRTAEFTGNLMKFIDGPPAKIMFNVIDIITQPAYYDIQVEIGLEHPFPSNDIFTAFDTMLVIISYGGSVYPGPESYAVPGENDQVLNNADGYTRWFNPVEFKTAGEIMPLLGYYESALGSADYIPDAVLNPYKYYSSDLDAYEDASDYLMANPGTRGVFYEGSVMYRYFDLRFPSDALKFQFATIIHSEPNMFHPDPPGPGILPDFPIAANSAEALILNVVDTSSMYYVDAMTNGGNLTLDISPIDWDAEFAPDGEYIIKLYSDAWAGPALVDMTPIGSGNNFYTFKANFPATSLTSNDPLQVWIEINYPLLDYTNLPFVPNDATGPLASYFKIEVPVSSVEPPPPWILVLAPNGGEQLEIGTSFKITWDFLPDPDTDEVLIEYSKDNFAVDINPIWTDNPNDGSYLWHPIPDDQSSTVRIRVTSTTDPSVTDVSDNDFEIVPLSAGSGWARTWGQGREKCFGTTIDSFGNIFATGYFRSSAPVDFDPDEVGEELHSSNGLKDVFVTMFDNTGNFIWARTWGGSSDDEGHGLDVDSLGNVYVTGYFKYTVDFDPGPGEDSHTAVGNEDVFLSKFDANGNFIWADTWGSSDNTDYDYPPNYGDCGEHVDVEGGSIYVTGDSGTPFARQYDGSGTMLWEGTWGGTTTWDRAYGIDVAPDGSYYICGQFTESVDFNTGGGVDYHTATDKADSYLVKYDFSNIYQWGITWGGNDKLTGYENPPYYVDCAYSVATDSAGNPYVAGIHYGTTDFNPGIGTENRTTFDTYGDGYIVKFNSTGSFQWVHTLYGEHFQFCYGVEVNDLGDVVLTGRYFRTVDFDPVGTEEHTAVGDCDMYASMYDTSGNWSWTRVWGAIYYEIGTGAGLDEFGNTYLSGYFRDTVDFDPGPGVEEHTATGSEDGVLIKLLANGYWE